VDSATPHWLNANEKLHKSNAQHVGVATPRDRGGSYLLLAEAQAFVKSWIESTILFDLYSKQPFKTVVNSAQVRVHIRLALKLIG